MFSSGGIGTVNISGNACRSPLTFHLCAHRKSADVQPATEPGPARSGACKSTGQTPFILAHPSKITVSLYTVHPRITISYSFPYSELCIAQ